MLRDRSPYFRATQIPTPFLLALGARDPRTPRAESDPLAAAIRPRGALTSLSFPEEGRELVRQQNRLSYLAVLEHFLGDCLGGRVEPVGASFEGAAIHVFDGAVNVPGLSAFARRVAPPVAQEAPAEVEPGDGAGGALDVFVSGESPGETQD